MPSSTHRTRSNTRCTIRYRRYNWSKINGLTLAFRISQSTIGKSSETGTGRAFGSGLFRGGSKNASLRKLNHWPNSRTQRAGGNEHVWKS
jgi:hypothetical protein